MDVTSTTSLSTPTKRSASPQPDQRPVKRPSTSSPEEGELDDPAPPSHSLDLPPRLPSPASASKFESKVKFPFKQKLPPPSSELRSSSRFGHDDRKPAQQYDRAPDDDHRRDKAKYRDHRPQDGMPPRRRMDRWVPDERPWDRDRDRRPPHPPSWDSRDRDRHPYDPRSYRPPPPHPSMLPHPPRGARDRYPGRDFDRDSRDLARTPPPPQPHRPRSPFSPHPSQSRSPSPSSPSHYRKHRLPARRSPAPNFSPLSRDSRPDRIRPELRDRDQRQRDDVYWGSAAPPSASRAGRRDHEFPASGEPRIRSTRSRV